MGWPKIEMPDREWLAEQYLLPPDGKGRSCKDIASELGVSKDTVQKWVQVLGMAQNAKVRQRYGCMKNNPMLAICPPNEEELAELYYHLPDGKGMTLDQMAEWFKVSRPTVQRWLDEAGIHQPFSERHSKHMSGKGNPAYTNGSTNRYVRRILADKREPICEWCGADDHIQIHHIDHNRDNNNLDNLMWLCGYCNRLESQLWYLLQEKRATLEVVQDENETRLTITFARR